MFVCFWHLADKPLDAMNDRYWIKSRQNSAPSFNGLAANEPEWTLGMHRGATVCRPVADKLPLGCIYRRR
jgi:hypothetical protein